MNFLDSQRRWSAEARRRATMRERVAQAEERAGREAVMAGFPLCGECGERHPVLPQAVLDKFRQVLESGGVPSMDDPLARALSAHSAADGGKKCH